MDFDPPEIELPEGGTLVQRLFVLFVFFLFCAALLGIGYLVILLSKQGIWGRLASGAILVMLLGTPYIFLFLDTRRHRRQTARSHKRRK